MPEASSDRRQRLQSEFIKAARVFRAADREFKTATSAWQTFSALHPADDPAHDEHHRRVLAARQALNGADVEFTLADVALQTHDGDIVVERVAKTATKRGVLRTLRREISRIEGRTPVSPAKMRKARS